MPRKRRKKNWSYKAGERGRNRVRAFQQARDGKFYLEWMEDGRRWARVLRGVADPEEAKARADELAAGFARVEDEPGETTLDVLIDLYMKEVTPTKGDSKQRHDRRAGRLWRDFFGAQPEAARRITRAPETLDRIDWDRFVAEIRASSTRSTSNLWRSRFSRASCRFLIVATRR